MAAQAFSMVSSLANHLLYRALQDHYSVLSGEFLEAFQDWNGHAFYAVMVALLCGKGLLIFAARDRRARILFSIALTITVLTLAHHILFDLWLARVEAGADLERPLPEWTQYVYFALTHLGLMALVWGLHVMQPSQGAEPLPRRWLWVYAGIALAQLVWDWPTVRSFWIEFPAGANLEDFEAFQAAQHRAQTIGLAGELLVSGLFIWLLLGFLRQHFSPRSFGTVDPVASAPDEWAQAVYKLRGLQLALVFQIAAVVLAVLLGLMAFSTKSEGLAKFVLLTTPLVQLGTSLWIALNLLSLRLSLPTSVLPLAILGLMLSVIAIVAGVYLTKSTFSLVADAQRPDMAPLFVAQTYAALAQLFLLAVLLALAGSLARAFPRPQLMGDVKVAAFFYVAQLLLAAYLLSGSEPRPAVAAMLGGDQAGWMLLSAIVGIVSTVLVARALGNVHAEAVQSLLETPEAPRAVARL